MIRLVGLGYLLLEQVYAVLQRRDVLGGGERLVPGRLRPPISMASCSR